jgi:hypothetical protein
MTRIALAEFATQKGQGEAAKILGTTQAAVSKALKTGRHIFVQEKQGGDFEAVELKPFPSGGSSVKASPDLEAIVSLIAPQSQHLSGSVQASSIGSVQ